VTWIVIVIELSKLLHLCGVSSLAIMSYSLLLLAYTLPFIRQIILYHHNIVKRADISLQSSPSSSSSPIITPNRIQIKALELFTYILIATIATYWSNTHNISHNILISILSRDPTDFQQNCFSTAILLSYFTAILTVFYTRYKTIRSVVFIITGILLLISLEGFGHLNMIYNDSSLFGIAFTSTTLSSSSSSQNEQVLSSSVEHPAIFLIISIILSCLAMIKVIPLQNFFICIAYSILFAFISTKAMINWVFPLSLGVDMVVTHDLQSFPFIYLYISKLFLSLTIVCSSQQKKQSLTPIGSSSYLYFFHYMIRYLLDVYFIREIITIDYIFFII